MNQRLPESFYQRDTIQVARELLGKKLFHRTGKGITSGIIIETEAYLGHTDRAAHTFDNHRSKRVESMYLPEGHAYIYLIYGLHSCFNVVTKSTDEGEAVLIRALYPIDGLKKMYARRDLALDSDKSKLCSGPGKLCEAMGLTRKQDGMSLQSSELWIEDTPLHFSKKLIKVGPRIGIENSREAKDLPLRFFVNFKEARLVIADLMSDARL